MTYCVRRAAQDLKVARTRLLIAKKCDKYNARRLRKPRARIHRIMRRASSSGSEDASDIIDKQSNRLHRIFLAFRKTRIEKGEAQAALDKMHQASKCINAYAQESSNVNTTLANVENTNTVATFFEAMGAGRVFEDVVRPWCSHAILAPPLPSHPLAAYPPGSYSKCNLCQEKGYMQACEQCATILCFGCVRNRHVCASAMTSLDAARSMLMEPMKSEFLTTKSTRFLRKRDAIQ